MLDPVATIYLTAYCAAQLGLLIGAAQAPAAAKIRLFIAGAAWLAVLVGAYALGGPPAGLLGLLPVNFLPFTLALAVLLAAFAVPRARAAMMSVPLSALVAVHVGRIGGLLFVLLYVDGRLSAPFGPVAGSGDMITGAGALLLLPALLAGVAPRAAWLRIWNVFGALDLIVAITLAALSAPGAPFQLFREGGGTQVLGTLPWILVPAFLVPVDLLAHLVIAAKLRALGRPAEGARAGSSAVHA